MTSPAERVVAQRQEDWRGIVDRSEALIQETPHDPLRFQQVMHHVELLLMEIGQLLAQLNTDRYEAEREWSRIKNVTMTRYMEHGVTFARAQGEVAALDARAAADNLKVILHHAEDTQKALQQKHYGLMNLNKLMGSYTAAEARRG